MAKANEETKTAEATATTFTPVEPSYTTKWNETMSCRYCRWFQPHTSADWSYGSCRAQSVQSAQAQNFMEGNGSTKGLYSVHSLEVVETQIKEPKAYWCKNWVRDMPHTMGVPNV
ncbi:MAG: hypothetical protein JW704_03485 [Anaerolineaceae bacterium]|nr:hypothetical protein [Anaerolineaceae bacterium]